MKVPGGSGSEAGVQSGRGGAPVPATARFTALPSRHPGWLLLLAPLAYPEGLTSQEIPLEMSLGDSSSPPRWSQTTPAQQQPPKPKSKKPAVLHDTNMHSFYSQNSLVS